MLDRAKLLQSIKNLGEPNFTQEFWDEFNQTMDNDNKVFIQRKLDLTTSSERLHRSFSL